MTDNNIPDQPEPHIVLHIILFILAIFWPFLVVVISIMGAKIFRGFELSLDVKERREGSSADAHEIG